MFTNIKHVKPGYTFTFYNGMIGTVTKGGKMALVSPQGYRLAAERQPNAVKYVRTHEVKKIDMSYKDPSPLAKKDDVLYLNIWTHPDELGIEARFAA